jgi:hypothetical protein
VPILRQSYRSPRGTQATPGRSARIVSCHPGRLFTRNHAAIHDLLAQGKNYTQVGQTLVTADEPNGLICIGQQLGALIPGVMARRELP